MNPSEPTIERLDDRHGPAARTAALDLVLRGLPAEVREPFVAGLLTAAQDDPDSLAELWHYLDPRDGQICGATWAQVRPGGAAVVWPPQWTKRLPPGVADPLLRRMLTSLAERGVTLAQSLLADRNVPEAATLIGCGFTHAVDLQYLTADVHPNDAKRAFLDEDYSFEPIGPTDGERLAALVEQTYIETRDCPALDGLRNIADVLDEYRTIGTTGPSLWRFVRRSGIDIGCLLLADHPSQSQVELVYMGIVPPARGGGGGAVMVREALRIAATLRRKHVVLAVDAANEPAAAIYKRCGFTRFDTRTVMICRLKPASADGR